MPKMPSAYNTKFCKQLLNIDCKNYIGAPNMRNNLGAIKSSNSSYIIIFSVFLYVGNLY